jgi:hypothetical protein
MSFIVTVKDVEAIHGKPNEASTAKVSDRITPSYRVLIDSAIRHQAARSHSRGEPRSSTLRPLEVITGRSPIIAAS